MSEMKSWAKLGEQMVCSEVPILRFTLDVLEQTAPVSNGCGRESREIWALCTLIHQQVQWIKSMNTG